MIYVSSQMLSPSWSSSNTIFWIIRKPIFPTNCNIWMMSLAVSSKWKTPWYVASHQHSAFKAFIFPGWGHNFCQVLPDYKMNLISITDLSPVHSLIWFQIGFIPTTLAMDDAMTHLNFKIMALGSMKQILEFLFDHLINEQLLEHNTTWFSLAWSCYGIQSNGEAETLIPSVAFTPSHQCWLP